MVCMAVCSGGAQLVDPKNGAASYEELLEHVPSGLKGIAPIMSGNDAYSRSRRKGYDLAWNGAVKRLCDGMRAKSAAVFAVVGATAKTWGYTQQAGWTGDDVAFYDMCVARLQCEFQTQGVQAVSGADELVGLVPVDSIGHVGKVSHPTVSAAYRKWLFKCLSALSPVSPVQAPQSATDTAAITTTGAASLPLHRTITSEGVLVPGAALDVEDGNNVCAQVPRGGADCVEEGDNRT